MKLDAGDILYFAAGLSVLLPLGARFAGNHHLARRLDLIPRFFFGTVSLMLALLPGVTFFNTDALHRRLGEADPVSSRILFGALGLFLFATGIRIIAKRDFDRPDSDE